MNTHLFVALVLVIFLLVGCNLASAQKEHQLGNIFFRTIGQMWEWVLNTYDTNPILGIFAGIVTGAATPPLFTLGVVWWIVYAIYSLFAGTA